MLIQVLLEVSNLVCLCYALSQSSNCIIYSNNSLKCCFYVYLLQDIYCVYKQLKFLCVAILDEQYGKKYNSLN